MNLHDLRQPGAPVEELVRRFGRQAVVNELGEMCYEDLAGLALEAAVKIDADDVALEAAEIVLNSGSYSEAARAQARTVLRR